MNIEMLTANKGVRFIILSNDVGMEVTLCSFGASIYQLKMDLIDMILTPKNFDDFYHSGRFYGMTIGRIAGRVKNGLLKVGDKEYQLDQNEGTNCHHGGFNGICKKNWRLQIETAAKYITVKFYLTTKKGESGFNGKCDYIVTYKLYADRNILEINYDAVCKEDTYFAMTNHAYFNLGHEKDILNHSLRIKANEVSTFDESDFTINGYQPVEKTPFDFREFKLIRKDINNPLLHNSKWLNGYDHRFKFHSTNVNEPKISFKSQGYQLDIYTDFDAAQIYSAGFSNHEQLITEDYDDIYRGLALECMNLEPEFVQKRQHYSHNIKYSFWRKTDEK